MKVVNKALKKLKTGEGQQGDQSFIMVKADKKLYKVAYSDILFVQSMGDFVKIQRRRRCSSSAIH